MPHGHLALGYVDNDIGGDGRGPAARVHCVEVECIGCAFLAAKGGPIEAGCGPVPMVGISDDEKCGSIQGGELIILAMRIRAEYSEGKALAVKGGSGRTRLGILVAALEDD